jgi:hypothetical protein
MTEIEILNNSQLGFIQNAIFTVAVVINTFIAFRLARVVSEKNGTMLAKSFVTLYGAFVTFHWITISSYTSLGQKGLAYSLAELKATGVKLSAGSEAVITTFPINFAEGYPPVAPSLPSILFASLVFLLIIGITWMKNSTTKS